MTTGSVAEQVTSVPGELHYLSPQSTVLRRFTAPGASVNTGSYESHVVPIRNGRPVQDTFRLDTHGFEIVATRAPSPTSPTRRKSTPCTSPRWSSS